MHASGKGQVHSAGVGGSGPLAGWSDAGWLSPFGTYVLGLRRQTHAVWTLEPQTGCVVGTRRESDPVLNAPLQRQLDAASNASQACGEANPLSRVRRASRDRGAGESREAAP